MAGLQLNAALTANERTAALLDGTVTPAGIDLAIEAMAPGELFWRQLKFAEFDVSEMSLSDLMIATAQGNREWLALPVYTLRRFYHTQILIRRGAGIARPQDLRGKRVGVPEYQLTSIVWARGVVKDDYGVEAHEMTWFVERPNERSHGEATAFVPPPGVRISYLPPEKNLGEMMVAGELDALFHYINLGDRMDRSRIDLRARDDVTTLYPDPVAEGRRYLAATGIYPVNHCAIVRRSVLERHPWVGQSIYDAFVAASPRPALPEDPWTYGMRNSRAAVETIERYLDDQGLLARRVSIEEVFAPASLGT